ncbi:MAG: UDP-N-acetylmuramate dehydrogenase [Candidatus Cloacimonadaceae bacterium]
MQQIDRELISAMTQAVGEHNIRFHEPMALHTTFRVGGPADIFVIIKSKKALITVLNLSLENGLPYFILGKGSNLIVSDKGIRGLVISTLKMTNVQYYDDSVVAWSGYELWKLSQSTAARGLTGLEFACGIPGTVGGAVYMNAGAYDGEISNVLTFSEVLKLDNSAPPGKMADWHALEHEDHDFSYRHSVFQDQDLIHLCSTFKLERIDKRKIKAKIIEFTRAREEKQPLELPSAGSVFRRPEGFFVGKLIQDCDLKGFRIGGAAISEKHCGFIVNLGNATSKDILALIEHVRNAVQQKFGVLLQTEVRFVGEK